ncbi:glycoside hydrolase [Flavobacterium akiainvivens]|uniref:Glycoside hydrolase n=1 Tax=Flavobacterium akiainvivens TaxID=1202724 RepID=A0A0M9VHK2_9FLAO|nr:family 43 glycosylhydrolase [Flavobacterium akiainvivens]KOS05650.1 glycoside hydrolase [Flavobacterium akiainvivens]SFQ36020.1 Glycosyl hydrolases family 43 [Flavobacterium akiainvivens]
MKKLQSILLSALFSLSFAHAQQAPEAVPDKDLKAYLFVYFGGKDSKGNHEAVRYAISPDGYHYYTLNNNNEVLDSKNISTTGGVRDPHILRGPDGKTFYMACTDMVAANGWDSNRAMVLLKSTDLVNWTSSVVNIQTTYPKNQDLKRVWAPQTIYDAKASKFMVYFSMKHGNGPDIIYYAYANKDFTALEAAPKPLFIPKDGKACIDGDIIERDGVFNLFYKTETDTPGIKVATTTDLTSGKWKEFPDYLQQTPDAVEGAGVFKLSHSDEYILMYDVYKSGKYQFTKSTCLQHFKAIDNEVTMDFHPRHGTILPITRSELNGLIAKWGKPANYSEIDQNPVLEGFYADPEILYSNKTGKYYIYPTSDGFDNWGGYYFKVFSSDNLTNWKDEGVILDLKKDVSWAHQNAWAPCIVEKKIKGQYKYFYYFTANKQIGVAVSDNPTGPFTDSGKALINFKPEGITKGQEIDPDVFIDPKSGKTYLYWGNSYMAVAELNDDMVSLKQHTQKTISIDKTFREGTYVIYRKGTYYFMWSEDDTRSPNYKVRYGTAKSPLGPITIPENNIVIQADKQQGIYGTGHHSVVQVPGKDEWYIVYHRFPYPNRQDIGPSAGYHREICIDRMEFDKQGNIIEVKPTLKGISLPKK